VRSDLDGIVKLAIMSAKRGRRVGCRGLFDAVR
jgi:hypothetical protein